MRIIVSDIPHSGLEQEFKMAVTLYDDKSKNDVYVFLKAFKVGDKVLIDGKAEAETSLVCSRCLKEFSYPMNVKFDVEYVPFREFAGAGEYELAREELDLSFYKNDEIDIEELVMEHLLLALPMKPLCSSDCLGLCPKCGKDLNKGICECRADEIDPRLSPLKNLIPTLRN